MPKNNIQNPQVLKPATKPAIILVHGFRGSPIGLKKIAQYLRSYGYEVHVPAIPPFSDSKKLPEYTPKRYGEYLANYVRQNNLTLPLLIGHSMGTLVVASALQHYPKLFYPKAILMSPISKRTAAPFRLVAPFSGLMPRYIVDYVTTRFLFIPRHNPTLFQETLAITNECSNDHPPLRSEVLKAAAFSTRYAVTDFHIQHCQLLLLAGAKDRLVSSKQTLAAAEVLHAKTKFLPNTGHLHNYEQPEETALAIKEFIESTS